jgi:hypothetical protein
LRIPSILPEAGGKFYKEKEGKKSTNVINSDFSNPPPPCFSNLRIDTVFAAEALLYLTGMYTLWELSRC